MTAPKDFETAAIEVATEMVKLLVERHRKYGPSNINRHGETGIVIRIGDKLSRLERAYGLTPTCWKCGAPYGGDMQPLEDVSFSDESLEDAWVDAGNYPIVALMLRRGWWMLPLRDDPPDPANPLPPDYA